MNIISFLLGILFTLLMIIVFLSGIVFMHIVDKYGKEKNEILEEKCTH